MKTFYHLCALCVFASLALNSQAQLALKVGEYLIAEKGMKRADVAEIRIDQSLNNKKLGVEHLYFSQMHQGLRMLNAQGTAVMKSASGKVVSANANFRVKSKTSFPGSNPVIGLTDAVSAALQRAGMQGVIKVSQISEQRYLVEISDGSYHHTSKAELGYYFDREEAPFLVWNFDIEWKDGSHWYSYFIDANGGVEVVKKDWQVSCSHATATHSHGLATCAIPDALVTPLDGSGYRIFPFPIESPNHGGSSLISEPGLASASPFGWHDTNGVSGSEFTITRGNNVYAYEDSGDNNGPGFSPNGGLNLLFDYPYNQPAGPDSYQSASITNLFYANNRIHDLLAVYGFDEPSGNFQSTNYTGEGEGNDFVRAEAQDGGGSNNANMATPPEGSNPRMQMYLWSGAQVTELFTINAPSALAGTYTSSAVAGFGPQLPLGGITAAAIFMNDNSGTDPLDGCEFPENSGALSGKIALVNRGNCNFTDKVLNAQSAGAVACVVINNASGLIAMGGTASDINIPSLMITQTLGAQIQASLGAGNTVNVTLNNVGPSNFLDGSFDNGIVIHEYVHGLTNRLTGGSQQAGCLQNEEQMGEGWSDWYAAMFTMDLDVPNPTYRPIGTFASGQGTQGNGIRPVPYDTSFAVNNFTYANLPNSNISIPHGVGFVWATMLWDLTWALINEYGFDPNLDTGTTGNNIALQLVTEGLKLQVCEPGFIDGRDAILLADELLYEGANNCLIWKVFAKRGLGFSASQGSSQNRGDGTAAFDRPTICQEVLVAPTAAFSISDTETCLGTVLFTDLSEDIPQFWLWDFGDGAISELQNPVHTYTVAGSYTVSLTVGNLLGEDILVSQTPVVYQPLQAPELSASSISGCVGESAFISATTNGGIVNWFNQTGQTVGLGNELNVFIGSSDSNYTAYAEINDFPNANIGPVNNSFGSGNNHATSFTGTVDFVAIQPLRIGRAWVISGAIGTRVINLWDGPSATGSIIDQRAINIDFIGGGWINLDFEIQLAGDYSMGLNQANLFRNNGGVSYPYTEANLMTITGSSGGPQVYYYFYNIEVDRLECRSEVVTWNAISLGNGLFNAEIQDLTVSFTPENLTADSYLWNFGEGSTSQEQSPVFTFPSAAIYNVTLATNPECQSEQIISLFPLSVDEKENEWLVFPNPANERIVIANTGGQLLGSFVRVFDARGAIVKSFKPGQGQQFEIATNDLANGLYTLDIQNTKNGVSIQRKVVISH